MTKSPRLQLTHHIIDASERIEKVMLEHLKRLQATLERVESKTDELIIRMGRLKVATAATKR